MSTLADTGLPELPEGFVWWVNHPHEPYNDLNSLTGSPGYYGFRQQVRDVNKLQVLIVEVITEDVTTTTGRLWWKRTVVKQVERKSSLVAEQCQGTHPVAVLNAANRALRRFNSRRAAAALVGYYPPKSLTV